MSHSRLARGHEVEGTLPGQVYRLTDTVFLLSRLTQSEGREKTNGGVIQFDERKKLRNFNLYVGAKVGGPWLRLMTALI